MTESALAHRPNIDEHDAVALRAFLRTVSPSEPKPLLINNVEVYAQASDNVEDLIRKYHKAHKQSS